MLARPSRRVLLAAVLGMTLVAAASRRDLAGAVRDSNAGRLPTPGQSRGATRADEPVEAQMRNVDYHAILSAVLNIHHLRGELLTKNPGKPPIFDDKNSFSLKIHSAEIAMTEKSLAGLLNDHVFAYPGSPLGSLEISIEPDRVIQKGVLRKALRIPFTIAGTVSLTPEGDIRVHPTSIKVAGLSVRKLMQTFGIELEKLVKLRQERGVRISGNDFLLTADRMLPPPEIQGKVTAVKLERGRMVLTFGSPGQTTKAALSPPDPRAPNYMYYQGGTLAFGKLTMKGTELQIVDADPRDPFDFFLDRYNDQLVAGYDENLPDHGLLVHMVDFDKIGKPGGERGKPRVASIAPKPRS